jgi:hypothetical protein
LSSEGRRPFLRYVLSVGLCRQGRGVLEEPGRGLELVLVLHAIGDGLEGAAGEAPDDGEEARGLGLRLGGQGRDPFLDLVLAGVGRVEITLRRLGRRSGYEALVAVLPVPGALLGEEIAQPRLAERAAVLQEPQQSRGVPGPDLLHEDGVHQLGRLHELAEGEALVWGQGGGVRVQVDRRESGLQAGQPGGLVLRGLGMGRAGAQRDCQQVGEDGAGGFHRRLRLSLLVMPLL